MLEAETPNAARFDVIVLEYIVKHWPPAHIVVVVCVSALKIVVKPVAPKKDPDPSPSSDSA